MGINLGTLFLLLMPLGLVVIISSIIGWIMGKIFDSNLKAWLKGGLIVTTYGIFVYIIDILLGIGLIFNFPASRLSNYVPHFGIPSGWIIAYLLINFIIGAIIGWIYGKIKAKKQQPIQIK